MLSATSLLAVRINKCQHLKNDKNAILCIENRRSLSDVFNDNHGELPKGFELTISCNTATDTSKGTAFRGPTKHADWRFGEQLQHQTFGVHLYQTVHNLG